nr:hypothetical protein [Tanacetum cinerariifolium]
FNATISVSKEEVIELDDSLRWAEMSQSLWLVIVLPGRVPEPEDEASQLAVEESGVDESELDQIEDFSESNEEFSSIDDNSFSIDKIDYVEASSPDYELVSSEVMEIVIPEISSGNTTTPPDISLPEYEVFHDDHVKEISSSSPTTHSDSPLYASFMFDLSINLFPPADRSDFYEFTDELIPFISAPEDFTKDVMEDISPTKEPQVLTALPTHPTLQLNMKFQPSSEYLFTYVVWIFLPFLVYSVAPYYLLSLQNEDIIFDLGICKSTFSRTDLSHRYGTVKILNTLTVVT